MRESQPKGYLAWTDMGSGHKKVVVRQFGQPPAWGYLGAAEFVREATISLLLPDGRINFIGLNEIKLIAYVRDFNLDDSKDPERIGRRVFLGRPRGEGLWLRLRFQDDDTLEGIASFDLALMDMLLEDQGFALTPPDGRGNTQRIFVPRAALRSVEVLAAITSPSRRGPAERAKRAVEGTQPNLFGS